VTSINSQAVLLAVPTEEQLERLRQILDQPQFLSNAWRSGLDDLL
jgi:hypothetical protein